MKHNQPLSPREIEARIGALRADGFHFRTAGRAFVVMIVLIVGLLTTLEKPAALGNQPPGVKRPSPTPTPRPTPASTPIPASRPARPAATPAPTLTSGSTPKPKPRSTPRPAPAPLPSLPPSRWPELKTCEFETTSGSATERRRGQAQYFTEELSVEVRLEMVAIPEGTFRMGSPESEKHRSLSESPLLHGVTITAFFMGRFEVTQAQWRAVAGWQKEKLELNPSPAIFKGDHRPVEYVSWAEAMEFCARLSRHTGRSYRLPSEAEWEYACRAGTTTPFAFGETLTPQLANYGNYVGGGALRAEYANGTTPVGYFRAANLFGLYDMHGNVWEWCLDVFHASYSGAPTDGSAWESAVVGSRVKRGGSWGNPDHHCRSARRGSWDTPDDRIATQGFRIAMSDTRSTQGRTSIK